MKLVLSHNNTKEQYTQGTLGEWTDIEGVEWELYFDTDGDFQGVAINNLTEDQIKQLEQDCIENEGFYSPEFNPLDIEQYSISYPLEEIITVQEAAEILGISERGVRWNCESGKYKARKAGKVWLIDRKSIEMQKVES